MSERPPLPSLDYRDPKLDRPNSQIANCVVAGLILSVTIHLLLMCVGVIASMGNDDTQRLIAFIFTMVILAIIWVAVRTIYRRIGGRLLLKSLAIALCICVFFDGSCVLLNSSR